MTLGKTLNLSEPQTLASLSASVSKPSSQREEGGLLGCLSQRPPNASLSPATPQPPLPQPPPRLHPPAAAKPGEELRPAGPAHPGGRGKQGSVPWASVSPSVKWGALGLLVARWVLSPFQGGMQVGTSVGSFLHLSCNLCWQGDGMVRLPISPSARTTPPSARPSPLPPKYFFNLFLSLCSRSPALIQALASPAWVSAPAFSSCGLQLCPFASGGLFKHKDPGSKPPTAPQGPV